MLVFHPVVSGSILRHIQIFERTRFLEFVERPFVWPTCIFLLTMGVIYGCVSIAHERFIEFDYFTKYNGHYFIGQFDTFVSGKRYVTDRNR